VSRRLIIPLAALALLVPVGAVALDRGSSGLDITSSLEWCGVSGDAVFCNISASFNLLEDGEFYTATVTAPDSTVQDLGRVATGGEGRTTASLWVPFAGNGAYIVEITAWTRDADGEATRVAKEKGSSEPSGASVQALQEATEQGALSAVPVTEQGALSAVPVTELEDSALLPDCQSEGDDAPAEGESGTPAGGGEPETPGQDPDQPAGGAGGGGVDEGDTTDSAGSGGAGAVADPSAPEDPAIPPAPGSGADDALPACDETAADASGS
jgi:hypothetical protein